MDREGFRGFLRERKLPEEKVAPAIAIVERFETFLQQPGRSGSLEEASPDDVTAFSATLIREKHNTRDNYVALARYGWFIENNPLYIAAVELVDGSEAFDNLYERLGKKLGDAGRSRIFKGTAPPPLGTPNAQKPRLTQTVIARLERDTSHETCKRILGAGLRTLSDEPHLEAKKKYQECGSIDAYLERKAADFIAELGEAKQSGRLWFTQQITDDVLEYVRSRPEVASAVRKGNVLYKSKIPYMTREFLAETDERMKRYYYCHCPWVRESLRAGDAAVPPIFCNCSAAFCKKPWEVIFGQPLEAEVVETILQGDPRCRFAIHLPEGVA
jgi:hypothetical protein